ncbi:MAG: DUF1203 domain-containing protein [Pyrinomonadaceae bacterium]
MNYKVKPIPAAIASEVRDTLSSPQYKSLNASVSIASGYGPCRNCLCVFDQGADRRIYFTYNSFDGRSELPDPGPIFIHENECVPFDRDGFPDDLKALPLLFEAFGDESRLLSRTRLDPDRIDAQIREIFTTPDARFIHLRNAEAGCFVATIERD